jgi:hypothetical protein
MDRVPDEWRVPRICRDNDGNRYLVPKELADRFEELIEIEREMGMEPSDLLARELAKFDQYLTR